MIKDSLSSLLPKYNRVSELTSDVDIAGKVFGVVTNDKTPTPEMFEKAGGWRGLGSVFYLDYEQSLDIDRANLDECKIAKPLFPNQKYYPLVGEVILIFDLPSIDSDLSNVKNEKYWLTPISLWNNIHHNAQQLSEASLLGNTFQEKSSVNPLQPFEGDFILEGRNGNSIRFGSTVRDPNVTNFWSKTGDEGSPILIMTNGHRFNPKNTITHLEDINLDDSTILFTSTQTIPLKTDKIILNALTKPIELTKYSNAQVILNSDRLVLNSKRDDVLVFAKTNIELYTKNIINLNSGDRTHINSPKVFLGTAKNGELPTEPLLLGDSTVDWLNGILKEIAVFANKLAVATSTPEGTPILQINEAAQVLSIKLENFVTVSDNIKSKQNYTI